MNRWNRMVRKSVIFIFLIFSTGTWVYAQKNAKVDENISILRNLVEQVYNNRNFEVINDLVAPGYIEYTNSIRSESSNTIKETVMFLLKTAPDFQLNIMDMIADQDKVVMRWIYNGNNEKYGKKVMLEGIYIARFKDKKIIEGWLIFDNYSRFKQLGYTLLPPPGVTEE